MIVEVANGLKCLGRDRWHTVIEVARLHVGRTLSEWMRFIQVSTDSSRSRLCLILHHGHSGTGICREIVAATGAGIVSLTAMAEREEQPPMTTVKESGYDDATVALKYCVM